MRDRLRSRWVRRPARAFSIVPALILAVAFGGPVASASRGTLAPAAQLRSQNGGPLLQFPFSAMARASSPRTTVAVGFKADFNGDGYGDLAVGAFGEDVGSISGAGAVNVLYGSSAGLSAASNQVWTQNSAGVAGVAETNDEFGQAVASGDFNKDGFTDLAVGVPGESVGTVAGAGAVNILYGSASGLTSAGSQLWDQASSGVADAAETQDRFGFALVARDFNSDGFPDLAVGVPYEDIGTASDEGAVNILNGSASGLTSTGNLFFQGAHAGDMFGWALAGANFNRLGPFDLAIGAPHATDMGVADAGRVFVSYGQHGAGLSTPVGLANYTDQSGARCGYALAASDFVLDGYPDLAAGCPRMPESGVTGVGQVDEYMGASSGLASKAFSYIGLTSAQKDAEFGSSLAGDEFGNWSNATGDDLAIGTPLADVGASATDAGAVFVCYGSPGGIVTCVTLVQGQNGLTGVAEVGDLFGAAVTTSDFNHDGWADLAIGVPGEGIGSASGAGAVNVTDGHRNGLDTTGGQFWSQNSKGVAGAAEAEDFFGGSLTGRA